MAEDTKSEQAASCGAPLRGIRVVDFTRFVQGPYAAAILADLGAEVIKIEERHTGEMGRRVTLQSDGFSGFFDAYNRGKKSVTLDLARPEGREVALRLIATCDVLVENFRPGVMDKLGLGYADARAANPKLIYASGSGYGTLGPGRDRPMFDQVGQAVAGFMDFVGHPIGEPRLAIPGLADQVGAIYLALGVVTALFARERLDIGQQLEASLLGSCIALQTAEITGAMRRGKVRYPRRRSHSTAGQFKCRDDKWIVIAANTEPMWRGLIKAMGREDLALEHNYRHGRARTQHADELEPVLEQEFVKRDRDDWVHLLNEHNVPAAPVNSYLDLPDYPDVSANGYVVERKDSRWGPINVTAHPIRYSATTLSPTIDAPEVGEHSASVLAELGYSEQEVADLVIGEIV